MFARSSNWLKLAPLPPLHDNDDDDDGNNGDDVGDFCNDKDSFSFSIRLDLAGYTPSSP